MSPVTAAPRIFQRRSTGSNSAAFPGKAPRQCLTLLLVEPRTGCAPWPAPGASQAAFPAYTQLSRAPVRTELSSPRPTPAVGGTARIYPTWIHPCRSARCSVRLANPTLSCRTLSQDHPQSPKHQIYVWQSPTEANKLKKPNFKINLSPETRYLPWLDEGPSEQQHVGFGWNWSMREQDPE